MKCIKRWRQWKNTNCHSAGDSGHPESSMMPAGEQGSRSLVTGSHHVARPAGSKHLEASLWTSQQEPGTEQRTGGWGGSQAGYLAAARGQLVRELATQSHKKACLLFFCCLVIFSHILMGKMKQSFSKDHFVGKGKPASLLKNFCSIFKESPQFQHLLSNTVMKFLYIGQSLNSFGFKYHGTYLDLQVKLTH